MIKMSATALGAAAVLLTVAPASATVVIDQATIPATGHAAFAGGTGSQPGAGGIAQTFTVGVSGILDHVVLAVEDWTFLGAAGDVRFELQDSAFHTLLTRDITAGNLADFGFGGIDWESEVKVDVRSAGIAVLAGERYVLKVASLGGYTSTVWRTGFAGTSINYGGGAAYSYDAPPGFPLPVLQGNDFGFATYVDDSPVGGPSAAPEPAAWALMILGFAGAGASLRRRQPATS